MEPDYDEWQLEDDLYADIADENENPMTGDETE